MCMPPQILLTIVSMIEGVSTRRLHVSLGSACRIELRPLQLRVS